MPVVNGRAGKFTKLRKLLQMTVACEPTDTRSLVPVAVRTLPAGEHLPVDMYRRTEDGQATLLLAKDRALWSKDIDQLLMRGVEAVYVAADEAGRLREWFIEKIVRDESRVPAARFALLRDAMKRPLHEAFRHGSVERIVPACRDFATGLAAIVRDAGVRFSDLSSAMANDASCFTHATNVATCSLLLAIEVETGGRRELAAIAQGALLHDFGKRLVQNKPPQERSPGGRANRDAIREHPTRGFQALCRRTDFPWDALMMVYQHHERHDGNGYPVGLAGREIHPWARICAIVNGFDGFRRHRSNQAPLDEKTILAQLDCETGKRFDEELMQCWKSVVTRKR